MPDNTPRDSALAAQVMVIAKEPAPGRVLTRPGTGSLAITMIWAASGPYSIGLSGPGFSDPGLSGIGPLS